MTKNRLELAVKGQHEEVTIHNVLFRDTAHFYLDGAVNMHDVQFWALENACVFTEKMHHAPNITV
jgi:hypothetical protein